MLRLRPLLRTKLSTTNSHCYTYKNVHYICRRNPKTVAQSLSPVSLSHTEPSIMGFSVFASAQMISSLEDEKVTFWKSHEKRFPNLRVLVEVARCLPSGNGAVERLFSMLKLLKQLHRNRLMIDNIDCRLKTRFLSDRLLITYFLP